MVGAAGRSGEPSLRPVGSSEVFTLGTSVGTHHDFRVNEDLLPWLEEGSRRTLVCWVSP